MLAAAKQKAIKDRDGQETADFLTNRACLSSAMALSGMPWDKCQMFLGKDVQFHLSLCMTRPRIHACKVASLLLRVRLPHQVDYYDFQDCLNLSGKPASQIT